MGDSSIEWTDKTWNPVRGCALVSPGCKNCYAMKMAHRFSGPGKAYEGLTELGPDGPRWAGNARPVPEMLEEPLHWKKPQRVFVNSMSDLFHEDVSFEFIFSVFNVMAAADWHTYQVLTKRPERMLEWCKWLMKTNRNGEPVRQLQLTETWPLPNVWLGVSVENQQYADERIPLLLQTPAAVRFISYEPALSAVNLRRIEVNPPGSGGTVFIDALDGKACSVGGRWDYPKLDWVIVGGESGPGARYFDVTWARSIVEQCRNSKVPVFVKQLGAKVRPPVGTWDEFFRDNQDNPHFAKWKMHPSDGPDDPSYLILKDPKGGDMSEWPEDLRVREFPAVKLQQQEIL